MAETSGTGTTIVDFQSMNEAISSYKSGVSDISEIMSTLQTISKSLSAANIFTGGAATSFIAAIDTTVTAMQGSITSLNSIINLLSNKLEAYQTANANAEAIANSIEAAQWADA